MISDNRARGTIYAYNDGKRFHVHADNYGRGLNSFTHNMAGDERSAKNPRQNEAHDDGQFSHYTPVPSWRPGQPGSASLAFPIGGVYRSSVYDGRGGGGFVEVPIQPGSWFRVGFRNEAFHAFQIPSPGELIEIPYEEMTWYGNTNYRAAPMPRDQAGADAHLPPAIQALLQNRSPQVVAGNARIVPVQDAQGELGGWEVWFENGARGRPKEGQTHGFSGTVVLLNEGGEGAKNAGLGLESMGCPGGGTSARQFISNGGDYGVRQFGVRAQPGTRVRLGIRGHSTFDTTLPSLAEGERDIGLRSFEEAGDEKNSNWFDGELLMQKLGEKKGTVDFFRNGKRINGELPDTVYVGSEAFDRAQFKNPPRVRMRWVDDSSDHPGGGWEIKLRSLLPGEDDLGRVGFTGQLKLLDEGDANAFGDPAAIPPGDFSPETREVSWFIPDRQQVAGLIAETGRKVVVDTGPLGWRATFELPEKGREIDTSKEDEQEIWVLCESDYKRAGLYPHDQRQ